jgi:hypothetical protein
MESAKRQHWRFCLENLENKACKGGAGALFSAFILGQPRRADLEINCSGPAENTIYGS